jgi:hypothetical protein
MKNAIDVEILNFIYIVVHVSITANNGNYINCRMERNAR